MPSMPQGVTSASLIVVILTAAAIGAVTGGIIGPSLSGAPLAVVNKKGQSPLAVAALPVIPPGGVDPGLQHPAENSTTALLRKLGARE